MLLGSVDLMRWRDVLVSVACTLAVAGCTTTVAGTPQRSIKPATPDPATIRGYGYTQDRCGLLLDVTVQEVVGADTVVRPYSGAVCQYVLERQAGVIDVTFSWFENGSLDRERGVAEQKKADITEIEVQRHQGFLARRPVTGNSCSATAATNPGIVSWWVQVRGADVQAADPCRDAETLLAKTLSSNL